MRIREIYFNNFRSFRGEHRISFVDPVIDRVRPVTVLAGSNGTGKTTILETIEGLLDFLGKYSSSHKIIVEAKKAGLIALTLDIFPEDLLSGYRSKSFSEGETSVIVHVAVGQRNLFSVALKEEWANNLACYLVGGSEKPDFRVDTVAHHLNQSILFKNRGEAEIGGGLLYLPYDRRLSLIQGGPIESPPDQEEVIFRLSNRDVWQGSLEQLWVWQNYLDLEQGKKERENLKPFVELVENVMGQNRKITIKEGRVTVPAGWGDNGEAPRVRLDQLPSGEQQVLLLFGELARRRRQGVIIAIDEIENSLHPTLQRLVMWNLRKIAREWDAQVIVTTHSLEVINTVRGGAFINLDYPADNFNLPLPDEADEEQAA
jgi:ABC-type lipoprotein export system ATPase subunit